jgi:predicted permease
MTKGLRKRLRAVFLRRRMERELDDELRFHLEKDIELNVARGMNEKEARAAALRSFGAVDEVKEESRDLRGVRFLEETAQDLRYGLRMMRKSPAFTAIAVLSLALGIGANTALFSVVDSVLLQKIPVQDPDGLVLFEWQAGKAFRTSGTSGYGAGDLPPGRRGSSSFNYSVYEAMQSQEGTPVTDLFGFAALWQASVSVDGRAEVSDVQLVTGRYFAGLGVPAALGRTLTDEDNLPNAAPAAVISHAFWQSSLGGDPDVLGKRIDINNVAFTIVGVAPKGFNGTLQIDMHPAATVPMSFEKQLSGENMIDGRAGRAGVWFVHVMGRLKPGATREQARASLAGTFQAKAFEIQPPPSRETDVTELDPKDYPVLMQRSGAQGLTESRRVYSSSIYILMGVVALVLLIACANVANMLLARSAARSSEITMRLAMGAGRWRLVRQLLTESMLLAFVGGAVGVLFAIWGTDALAAIGESGGDVLPEGITYGLNVRVLLFTLAVSMVTGALFGLAPALRATRLDLTSAMKESSRGTAGISRSRLSKTLVVAQVAMSLLLLFGAGLFLRTVHNLQSVELGFNQENLLVFTLRPGKAGYEKDRLHEFYRTIFERIEATPGVAAATFCRVPLVANNTFDSGVILPGETPQSGEEHITNMQIVRDNFFETMGIPLLAGRGFDDRDVDGSQPVAVVSEKFARDFFPEGNVLGQRVGFDEKSLGKYEIVGVVRDTKYSSLREDIAPIFYASARQETDNIGTMYFEVRTHGDPAAFAPIARKIVSGVDAGIPVTDVTTQEAQAARTVAQERVFADMLTFFGALAVLLAAIGLYGVMSYSVAQRTNEIGIRMALGAETGGVLRMVVAQGLKFAVIGLVIGSVATLGLTRFIEGQLYGVTASDPLTFAVVGALLLGVAIVACWIPALRAARVDPMVALRTE